MIRNGQVGDWRLSDNDFLAAFSLPTKRDKHEVLAAIHPIERDARITFDEESHTYTVDGALIETSVTTLIHKYSHEFDPQLAINSMSDSTRELIGDRFPLEDMGSRDIKGRGLMQTWMVRESS